MLVVIFVASPVEEYIRSAVQGLLMTLFRRADSGFGIENRVCDRQEILKMREVGRFWVSSDFEVMDICHSGWCGCGGSRIRGRGCGRGGRRRRRRQSQGGCECALIVACPHWSSGAGASPRPGEPESAVDGLVETVTRPQLLESVS